MRSAAAGAGAVDDCARTGAWAIGDGVRRQRDGHGHGRPLCRVCIGSRPGPRVDVPSCLRPRLMISRVRRLFIAPAAAPSVADHDQLFHRRAKHLVITRRSCDQVAGTAAENIHIRHALSLQRSLRLLSLHIKSLDQRLAARFPSVAVSARPALRHSRRMPDEVSLRALHRSRAQTRSAAAPFLLRRFGSLAAAAAAL